MYQNGYLLPWKLGRSGDADKKEFFGSKNVEISRWIKDGVLQIGLYELHTNVESFF